MKSRQYTTPMFVEAGRAIPLDRVPFSERTFDEGWLQKLLFEQPNLLPIEDIDPLFRRLVPVARELRTGKGKIDLVYANSHGFLTLAETKLWRSPQARREVVAQIIDYAQEMARWAYEDLVRAVGQARGQVGEADPLIGLIENDEEFDRGEFIDTVARNLECGRHLLLVVGDGIQEGVERMAEFLSKTPQLGFRLALVEMALYRRADTEGFYVQPRVVARTREIERAIIVISRAMTPGDVVVTVPRADKSTEPAEQDYFDRLRMSAGADGVELVRSLLGEAKDHGLEVIWSGRYGAGLQYVHEPSGHKFRFARFRPDGTIGTGKVDRTFDRARLPRSVASEYLDAIAALLPGAMVTQGSPRQGRILQLASGRMTPFLDLAKAKDQWWSAVDRTVKRIDAVLEGG
jgi:hypothetical protein